MIRTIITDDQALARDGLKMILSASPDIDVVATAENGAQAVDLVEKYKPDLVLMDLKMPVMNGILATRKIIERFPNMKVLVLTTYDADEWVFDAVRAGASGYLLKDATRDEILSAIARVMEGNTQVSPAIADKLYSYVRGDTVPDTTLARKLNPRELEILNLLANGLSNAEIARRVHLAEGTVRNYVSNIFLHLEVSDRVGATALAWRYGLAQPLEDDRPG